MKPLVCFLPVLLAAPALAWEPLGDPWQVPQGGVPYCLSVNAKDASIDCLKQAFAQAVESAAARWYASCSGWCSSVSAQCAGSPPEPTDWTSWHDGVNWIEWLGSSWPADSSTIAVTLIWDPLGGGPRLGADILFNDRDFTWVVGRIVDPAKQVDLQSIAVHELGHALGLDHYDSVDALKQDACVDLQQPYPSVMCAAYRPGSLVRDPRADDLDGLCALYPADTVSACADTGGPPPPAGPIDCGSSEPTPSGPEDDTGCACAGNDTAWWVFVLLALVLAGRVRCTRSGRHT